MSQILLATPLSSASKGDIALVGGKAINLGHLVRNNFPVPPGFVITTIAFEQFVEHNEIGPFIQDKILSLDFKDPESLQHTSEVIQARFRGGTIPDTVVAEVRSIYQQFSLGRVAVRSSATAEDLRDASFAGQQETFLNIHSLESVLDHVKKCYASLWTARAIAYRKTNKIDHLGVNLAVVVQAMVPAVAAGVLFTANPINLSRAELLVESNFGLGESIVSGEVEPDQFVIEKDADSLRIKSRSIAQKHLTTRERTDGGVDVVKLSYEEGAKPSLTDQQVIALGELGMEVEERFENLPQDIEWAIDTNGSIYILQSRAITTLVSIEEEDESMWTRGYSDDYWNDPVSPLFYTLLGNHLKFIVNDELNSIMGYTDVVGCDLLKLYQGHCYFNLEVLKKKVEYEIPPFIRSQDVLQYFPVGGGPYGQETMKKMPFALKKRLIAQLRVMLHDKDGSISKTHKAYQAWGNGLFKEYCQWFDNHIDTIDADDLSQMIAVAKELDRVMVPHYRLVRYGLPVHNIGMNLMTSYLLRKFLDHEEAVKFYPILISGSVNKTNETNAAIYHLVDEIHANDNLKEFVLQTSSEELYPLLEARSEFAGFLRSLNNFLASYGHRGFTREPYYPRWREEPRYIFDILKSLASDKRRLYQRAERDNLSYRTKVEQYVNWKVRSQRFGLLKWKVLGTILGFSREYIKFRESQRFWLDDWISRNRQIYLKVGQNFTQKGILDSPETIFFLRKEEIRRIARRETYSAPELRKLRLLTQKRREEFEKYENITPPKFLHGSRVFNDPDEGTGDGFYPGVAASQGVVAGKVRVLETINDIAWVEAGEILVVPKTDPGWTPVFAKIGGLITETGGVLSHGAVVSREYGIPAVTNVRNACQIFQNGQAVTLDGNQGFVRLIDN